MQTDDERLSNQIIERLKQVAAKPLRKYASFFESSEKEEKELNVCEELIEELDRSRLRPGLRNLQSRRPPEFPDPPDCMCNDADGNLVAIEVTEIVCQETIHLNQQGHNVYRNWNPGELVTQISDRLYEKDRKTFQGGPYSSIIVCLHTDEPKLMKRDSVERELSEKVFGPYQQIQEAYLLVSYDPARKGCPVYRLCIRTE